MISSATFSRAILSFWLQESLIRTLREAYSRKFLEYSDRTIRLNTNADYFLKDYELQFCVPNSVA